MTQQQIGSPNQMADPGNVLRHVLSGASGRNNEVAAAAMEHTHTDHGDDSVPILHLIDGSPPMGVNRSSWQWLAFLAEPFRMCWWHRDLIAAILRRELQDRFKGSIAGWVWAVVAPLLSLTVYTIMFNGTLRLPNSTPASGPFDYALFTFGGLIAFNFFSEMAYRAPSLLHEYAHFIKQTMFPAEMLPVISTLRATVYASIGLALMVLAQLVLAGSLHWTLLLLPLWFLPFVIFLIGMTWFLSALGAHTRDVGYFMMTILPLLMFATPVFFTTDHLTPALHLLMYLNILVGFIEIVRDITVLGRLPAAGTVLWTLVLSLSSFYIGYWFFRRQRGDIADVL